MGSDLCICQYVFRNEQTESNILSKNNHEKEPKDITEKPYLNQYKKNMEQDTLAEEKDNIFHFGDVNSNRNVDFYEKPSNLRKKDDVNQRKENKVFFIIDKNKNDDNSKNTNTQNNNVNNNNQNNNVNKNQNNNVNKNQNNNNNEVINNTSVDKKKSYKKIFTFKELNLKNTTNNEIQNCENDLTKQNEINNNSNKKNNNNDEENIRKLLSNEVGINDNNKINEGENERESEKGKEKLKHNIQQKNLKNNTKQKENNFINENKNNDSVNQNNQKSSKKEEKIYDSFNNSKTNIKNNYIIFDNEDNEQENIDNDNLNYNEYIFLFIIFIIEDNIMNI